METVTQSYHAYPHTRHIDAKVTFGVVAPDAAKLARIEISGEAGISRWAQTINQTDTPTGKYASAETGLWLLDGSCQLPDSSDPDVELGWWSDVLSNEEGVFQTPPYIRYDFPENQDSFGFILSFDQTMPEEYPAEIQVRTYDELGALMESNTYAPDKSRFVINLPTQGYRGIEIQFIRTRNPLRRVRLCEFTFGIVYEYGKGDISDLSIVREVDPLAQALPSAEFSVTLNNQEKLFNLANPGGIFAFLQDGQALDAQVSIEGEWVNLGRSYFSTAKSTDGAMTAQITANDRMLQLENFECSKGSSGTWTLLEAVNAILKAADMEAEILMPEGLNETIGKAIPEKTKCREALRLACQAARCTCYFDREDRLRFVRPALQQPADVLSRDCLHNEAQIAISNTYNTVRLTVKDDYANTEQQHTASQIATDDYERAVEVDNPLALSGDAVAAWLLQGYRRFRVYDVSYRGNPAIEVLDTATIHDYYGANNDILLTEHELKYDGGLKGSVMGVG